MPSTNQNYWTAENKAAHGAKIKSGFTDAGLKSTKRKGHYSAGRMIGIEKGHLSGERSPFWKGGRYRMWGYVMLQLYDASGKKYRQFEHRKVMEEVLGRKLKPHENVHHKNGVKDDNRPENLELWVRKQPVGQRKHEIGKHCGTCTCSE